MIHISLTAEEIARIGFFPITNSMLMSWLVMLFLFSITFLVRLRMALVPGRLQLAVEGVVGGVYGLFQSITGDKTKLYFPIVGTIFLYVIFMNWAGLLPGVGSIGLEKFVYEKKEFIPLFRAGSADLNTTLALAVISVVSIQFFGIRALGLKYFKRFLNFSNPIYFFVGILEIISEFSKIISFAFRLFGNIFAGEVLLTVIAFLMPFFAPLPFLGLELFVGFIQALVFSMLTAVFLSVATADEH